MAIFKISHFEDEDRTPDLLLHDHRRDRHAIDHDAGLNNKQSIRMVTGGGHQVRSSNLTKESLLDRLKGQINKTIGATDQLKQHLKDADRADGLYLDLPNYNVHAFYYPWYGNPEHDGRYLHWNHRRLPHWNPEVSRKVFFKLFFLATQISASKSYATQNKQHVFKLTIKSY